MITGTERSAVLTLEPSETLQREKESPASIEIHRLCCGEEQHGAVAGVCYNSLRDYI